MRVHTRYAKLTAIKLQCIYMAARYFALICLARGRMSFVVGLCLDCFTRMVHKRWPIRPVFLLGFSRKIHACRAKLRVTTSTVEILLSVHGHKKRLSTGGD